MNLPLDGKTRYVVFCIFVLIIAVGVQILYTLQLGSLSVRMAVSDLVLPFGFASLVYAYFSGRLRRPNWVVPHIPVFLLGFLFILGMASLIGFYRTDAFIAWAWGPKLIGFFVLLMYFVVGVIVTEAGHNCRQLVLSLFMATSWLISIFALVRFVLDFNGVLLFDVIAIRPIGLSENPNAFAFLLAVTFILQIFSTREFVRVHRYFSYVGAGSILALLFLIGSRSVFLGVIFALPAAFYFRKKVDFHLIFVAFLIGCILLFLVSIDYYGVFSAFFNGTEHSSLPDIDRLDPLDYARRDPIAADGGVVARWQSTILALNLWRDAPIFGIGLGGVVHYYSQIGEFFTLHTTGLWLLVETGLVGFSYFLGIYVALVWSSFRLACEDDSGVSASIFTILIFSLGVSIGTEILYQRHLWFLVGLAVAYPRTKTKRRSGYLAN